MRTANLAIVFTDIKGFTERTSRQTLEQNEKLLATHNALLTPVFRAFNGRIVKSIGDAFLVTFESPTNAVLAAVAAQDKLWEHNRGVTQKDDRIDVRIAINVGEVRVEGGDVFGEPVNITARIEGIAEAGQVYFTEAVYLAMNKAELPAEEVGQFELKGIPGKVRVYRVPHAPYRVEAAAPGAPDDSPPFGSLGLAKMSAGGAGPELSARASEAYGALKKQRGPMLRIAVGLVGAIALSAVVIGMLAGPSALEKSIREVHDASTSERNSKIIAAQKLISEQKEVKLRDYWYGRLQQEQNDPQAPAYYRSSARAGYVPAEDALIGLLDHSSCHMRVAAAEAIKDLRLKRAKDALQTLKDHGGADDSEVRLFNIGCNSARSRRGSPRSRA